MSAQQAFRYELNPNTGQGVLLAKHAGAARFAWNWALAERIRRYRENEGRARFTNAVGVEHDRDGNAARGLVAWYRLTTGSSPGSHACGEPSGGAGAQAPASHVSTKQESAVEHLSIS